MNIDVSLRLNEELKTLDISKITSSELANGYCEIENIIKFPVKVMKYTDKQDGKVKMFVSFPQKKIGDKYDEIVHPVSKDVRAEVQDAVLKKLSKSLSKEVILTEDVSNVKVNLLKEPVRTGPIVLKAMASITLCGFVISGIQVKESERGLLIQMPQYKVGNNYQDTVYGTNRLIQQEIKNKVIEEYNRVLERNPRISRDTYQTLEEMYPNPFDGQNQSPKDIERNIPNENTSLQKDMNQGSKNETLIIDKAECKLVDTWKNHYATYTVGQCVEEPRFYFVRFETNGKRIEDIYYHQPTREEVEDDHISRLAQMELDEHEKTYATNGSKNLPNESKSYVSQPFVQSTTNIKPRL